VEVKERGIHRARKIRAKTSKEENKNKK